MLLFSPDEQQLMRSLSEVHQLISANKMTELRLPLKKDPDMLPATRTVGSGQANEKIVSSDIPLVPTVPLKVCGNCGTSNTPLWRREGRMAMCNACGIYFKIHGHHRPVQLILAAHQSHRREERDLTLGSAVTKSKDHSKSSHDNMSYGAFEPQNSVFQHEKPGTKATIPTASKSRSTPINKQRAPAQRNPMLMVSSRQLPQNSVERQPQLSDYLRNIAGLFQPGETSVFKPQPTMSPFGTPHCPYVDTGQRQEDVHNGVSLGFSAQHSGNLSDPDPLNCYMQTPERPTASDRPYPLKRQLCASECEPEDQKVNSTAVADQDVSTSSEISDLTLHDDPRTVALALLSIRDNSPWQTSAVLPTGSAASVENDMQNTNDHKATQSNSGTKRRRRTTYKARISDGDYNATAVSGLSWGFSDSSIRCYNCHTDQTPLWRKDKVTGGMMCNACGIYKQAHGFDRPVSRNGSVLRRAHHKFSPEVVPKQPLPFDPQFTNHTQMGLLSVGNSSLLGLFSPGPPTYA